MREGRVPTYHSPTTFLKPGREREREREREKKTRNIRVGLRDRERERERESEKLNFSDQNLYVPQSNAFVPHSPHAPESCALLP